MDVDKLTEKQQEYPNQAERLAAHWGSIKDRFTKCIEKHENELRRVDKIICFGLGALELESPRSYVQHLAAVFLRDEIKRIRGKDEKNPDVQILAQDPAYCIDFKEIMRTGLDIEAVDTFESHMSLTHLLVGICDHRIAPREILEA
jgi:hypothetical protein